MIVTLLSLNACFEKPPVNRDSSIPLNTVSHVNLDRYLGTWYEVARFENSFQDKSTEEHCVETSAEYSLSSKKDEIRVVNRCRMNTPEGKKSVAEGNAKVLDKSTNAKLGVKFFFLAPRGDYWILALGDDYEYSLVGEPEGRYLWLLSRDRILSDALIAEALEKARILGYNTKELRFDPKYE